ncbi:MAG: hypothetical protein ACP5PJ_09230 [Acidimicrobiales bacterium]
MTYSRYRDVSELRQALVGRDVEVSEDVVRVEIELDRDLLDEVSYRISSRTTRSLSAAQSEIGLRGLLHPARLIEDARARSTSHRPLELQPLYRVEVRRMQRKVLVRSLEDSRYVLGPCDLSQGGPDFRVPEDGVLFDLARLATSPLRVIHEFTDITEMVADERFVEPPIHVFGRSERRPAEPMLRLGSLRVCDLDRVTLRFGPRPPALAAMSLVTTHDPFRPVISYRMARL